MPVAFGVGNPPGLSGGGNTQACIGYDACICGLARISRPDVGELGDGPVVTPIACSPVMIPATRARQYAVPTVAASTVLLKGWLLPAALPVFLKATNHRILGCCSWTVEQSRRR